ncbi:V-type ATPase 116kDa subunit family protein [Erysipelothrix rhusiopathiae]|nr:V-type ATPase 116kDa subunit family protein [Erysipelothrix rhusiopathiae]MDE9423523.1 V-type ATPase 116kDa subunit family protein [Erysipelothrix rhusiopathiae]MDE9425540.1 V-type ATPase 116kDa subunit family protein [Erysipelothrix rhusiopathiae]
MAIEKMSLVMVSTEPKNVLSMIDNIMTCPNFHPELATEVVKDGDGGLIYPNDRIYDSYLSRCERIITDLHLTLSDHYDREYSVEQIENALEEAEQRYNTLHRQESSLSSLNDDDKMALGKLKEYPMEHVEEGFIRVHFGRIPTNSLSKITLHNDERFVFTELHRTKQYGWIVWICLEADENHLVQMFESLFFEPLAIPIGADDGLRKECSDLLENMYGYIKVQSLKEAYYKYITIYNQEAVIVGFIPEVRLTVFESLFPDEMKVLNFDASTQEGLLAPTRLKNGWFSRPFEMFVEMYSLPKYGEFDPTSFFAVTYCLLFGIMFGDLGQGFVIALGGYLLSKKKGIKLGDVAVRIGMFSMFFGLIYGSFFGNEEILKPLLAPLGLPIHVTSPDFTMTLLLTTVTLGVILILMSIGLNIVLSFKKKDFTSAIYSQNGIAGLMFYGFIMVAVALSYQGIHVVNPLTIFIFIVLPLLMILFKEPLSNLMNKMSASPHEGWGGYLVESFFELFEVLLSFIANTMSFLRVGGFVLSHAGMMSVVMTLNEMAGSAGILILIFGNIFVIGLEGLIVGIQTLRLEYYEMFSRYYDGGGKPFKSVY